MAVAAVNPLYEFEVASAGTKTRGQRAVLIGAISYLAQAILDAE